MSTARFEPRGFLKFDLNQGQLSTRDKRRHLVVPVELVKAAGEGTGLSQAARTWGEEQGAALASLIGEDVLDGSPEQFVTELGHLLAALGWGQCNLEAWGGVVFVVAEHAPRGGAAKILSSFLAGVFTAVGGERFECVPLTTEGTIRFVLTGPEGANEIQSWVDDGAEVSDVVGRMHKGDHLPATLGGR